MNSLGHSANAVTVVVLLPEGDPDPEDTLAGCLEAVERAAVLTPHRVVVVTTSPAAVRLARYRNAARRVDVVAGFDEALRKADPWLTVIDARDSLLEDAIDRLQEQVAPGVDVVVGVTQDAGGRRRGAVAEGGEAHSVRPADRLDLLADPDPGGWLLRLDVLRRAAVRLGSDAEIGVVVAATVLGARNIRLVPLPVHRLGFRDHDRPVAEQERFSPITAAAYASTLLAVSDLVRCEASAAWERWALAVLEHTLPPWYRDAVLGGARFQAELGPLVRHLLAGVLEELRVDRLTVPARLGAWATAELDHNLATRLQAFLADHPHGLPTERASAVVSLPTEFDAPEDARTVGRADRRLHVRVTRRTESTAHVAAFVDYVPDGSPPTVRAVLADGAVKPLAVSPEPDPALNEWARRAFEDHARAGFTVSILEGTAGIEVQLDGRRRTVSLPRAMVPAAGATATLRAVEDGRARVWVRGVAGRTTMRLVGELGTGEAGDGDDLPLSTIRFGRRVALPMGRYDLRVTDANGLAIPVLWDGSPGEWRNSRQRLDPVVASPAVHVRAPLGVDERGAYAQQRLQSVVYAAPRCGFEDTVLLETFHGRSVGDNPGAVGAELASRRTGLQLAWVVDDPSVAVPKNTRAVVRRSTEWYALLSGARAYVANAAAPRFFRKRDGQVHVQTWHGIPLKRIGEDRGPGDLNTWRHRQLVAAQSARWDLLTSPSPFCTAVFRSAFRYAGEVLEAGQPRNDVLLAPDRAARRLGVRQELGVAESDRLVLYAPTWREHLGRRDVKPLHLDAVRVAESLPGTTVLVRGHYNASRQADVFEAESRIIDVTRYPDVAPLLLAADVLVTDYSSVMFDFVLTGRPVLLLVPDLEHYRDVERGFYFQIEDTAPGPLLNSTDEVIDALSRTDDHATAREAFRAAYCPLDDGSASARVVDALLSRL